MKYIIIAGSRTITDYETVKSHLNQLIPVKEDITIISGGAKGVDKLGEYYANEYNLPLTIIPANWDKYGKSAGYKRNEEMANTATHLIAFYDGLSKGTAHM